MSSGGARARSGPVADAMSLRQDRKDVKALWQDLPAEGRQGDAPVWPLDGLSDRERELWDAEWRRPQAVMWERTGAELEVALYVRRLAEAEKPGAATNLGTLVKQLMEGLGISQDGLAKRHWRIVVDELAVKRATVAPSEDVRARLQALASDS